MLMFGLVSLHWFVPCCHATTSTRHVRRLRNASTDQSSLKKPINIEKRREGRAEERLMLVPVGAINCGVRRIPKLSVVSRCMEGVGVAMGACNIARFITTRLHVCFITQTLVTKTLYKYHMKNNGLDR